MLTSPRDANDAITYLRNADNAWFRLCLMLTREARGIPPLFKTAHAAMDATPARFRIHDRTELRRGMVVYFDDPKDSNDAGHIVTFDGWYGGVPWVWSNDALTHGGVDRVPFDFFPTRWGDPFRFGATWLNGYVLTNTRGNLYLRDR